ncbi:sensor histidine kinase [Lutibacter holmesii]|uniref:histidine kinase n=1 Tax=Lutibacter holmesii TaxID=1137985 RepID=A0ABW3WPY6_9FLAO
MDIGTIINLLAIGNGVFSIIFLFFIYSHKNKRTALMFFAVGKILQTISWVLFIYYQNNLTSQVMGIGNIFQYFGLTFEVFGFTYVFTQRSKEKIVIWMLICSLFSVLYFFLASNIIVRVIISSCLFFGLYTFMFTRLVFSKSHTNTQHIVGWLALIFGLIHLCRGVYSVWFQVEFEIYNNAVMQVITGYMYIIVTFTFPVFLLLIVIEKDNQELYELNTTKNKLFRIIGHDLKSPMIQLANIAQIIDMKKGSMGELELEKLGFAIRDSSLRTSKLLDDLLSWARSQSNSLAIKEEKICIKDNFDENIDLFKGKLNEKNIEVINRISATQFVKCDANMLNTIIRNLLSNAIKFSFKNGKIDIYSNCENDICTISIKDEGMGIEKSNLKKMFKIDSNFTTLGTNDEKGTGIGLALCKEFVEKNKGEISVESTINKGTIFHFSLPC